MERKRVHARTDLLAVGGNGILTATIDESNGVNAHNLHMSFTCEPQDADANAAGQWVLWCLPDEASLVPNPTVAALEAEQSNAFLWAAGLWAASNQTPYVSGDITFSTTRNCQNGARLVFMARVEGVSGGLVRTVQLMTYNTKSL